MLVAFMLLVVMAAAGFATSRNQTRELAMAGDALRGAQAAAAAEAGLAWFLAEAATAGGPLDGPGWEPGEACALDVPELALAESPEAPMQPGSALQVRRLGALPRPGADPEGDGPAEQLWQVTAIGRSGPRDPGQDDFTQIRELLVARGGPPGQPAVRILAWRSVTPPQ
jgi:hypothetical protein